MSRKIVQIIPNLSGGGAERFVVDLANELSKNSTIYLVTLYDLIEGENDFLKKDINQNVIHISLGKRIGLDFKVFFKLYSFLKKCKADIVNTHLSSINYVILAVLCMKKTKFFHTLHSDATFEIKYKLEFLTRKFLFRNKFIQPITISEGSQQSFRNYYQLQLDKLIYNGRKILTPTNKIKTVIQEMTLFKPNAETRVIVNVGRFISLKRQTLLARIVDTLTLSGHDLALLLIGADPNSEESNRIESEILKLGNSRIKVLSMRGNIVDYLLQADAFCISSELEGLPISYIEAISVGCIPICTPVGGLPSLISPETGFLAKDLSSESLMIEIENFMNTDKYKLSILSNRNILLFNEKFNIVLTAKQYMDAYEKK